MPREPHVIGIGDADIDIFLEIDRLPEPDEKVMAHRVHRVPGGIVANALVTLARLGTATTFAGLVGDDHYGDLIRENFARERVSLKGLRVVAGQGTYFCVILVDPSGEKSLIVAPEPTMYPPLDLLTPDLLSVGTHAHTHGHAPLAPRALACARAAGLTVSVDLDAAPAGLDALRPAIDGAAVVFANRRGRANLGFSEPAAAIRALLDAGADCVALTDGAHGASAGDRHGLAHTGGWRVPVRDTTGAGDCFAGAFLHGHLRGWPLADTLRFANAAAALSVQSVGAQTGLPTTPAVTALLASPTAPPTYTSPWP